MAIRIQYQNNVTGAAFDITTLVSGAKWSTKRSGSPASLELTAIVNDCPLPAKIDRKKVKKTE